MDISRFSNPPRESNQSRTYMYNGVTPGPCRSMTQVIWPSSP